MTAGEISMAAAPATARRSDAGFTLTEIMVVVLIVGTLSAIAVPTLLTQRAKGVDAAAKSNVATAARALAIYETDHDTYACGTSVQCIQKLHLLEPAISGSDLEVNDHGGSGDATDNGYRVTGAGGDTRTFWQDRDPDGGATDRGCDLNGSRDPGGCRVPGRTSSGQW